MLKAMISDTDGVVWLALQGIALGATYPEEAGHDMPIISIFDADGVMTEQHALATERCNECGDAIATRELLWLTSEGDEPYYYNNRQVVLIPSDSRLTRIEHLDCVQGRPGSVWRENLRKKRLNEYAAHKAQIEAANKRMYIAARENSKACVAARQIRFVSGEIYKW